MLPLAFRARVELHGQTATGIEVPEQVVDALGSGRRPKVQIAIGSHAYRTTVAVMGGRYLVPLSAANRAAAGVQAGEEVEVRVELDAGPREVSVPADLHARLAAEPAALAFFETLAYTHRKEWVQWIESAKREQTRATRLDATLAALRDGRRAR